MTPNHPIPLDDTAHKWDDFVTAIAKRLSGGGVPNVLFGSYALSLYGVPYGFSVNSKLRFPTFDWAVKLTSHLLEGAELVVNDHDLAKTIAIFAAAGLPQCQHGPQCQELHARKIYPFESPSLHVHVQHLFEGIKDLITLKVYLRSKTLWELPDLSTFVTGQSHDVRKTSAEKRLDRGGLMDMEEKWKEGGDLWLPSTRVLFRAYALLAVRHDGSPVKDYWFDHILMMAIHLPDTGRLDLKSCGDDLQPLIRSITVAGVDMAQAWEETVSMVKISAA